VWVRLIMLFWYWWEKLQNHCLSPSFSLLPVLYFKIFIRNHLSCDCTEWNFISLFL
jgi:hypothetical protein